MRTQDVEEDGDKNQFDTAKDVSNFGGSGLCSGSNDSANNVDGGQSRMSLVAVGGGWLVGISQCSIESISVGDEEDAEEDGNAIQRSEVRGDGLDSLDTR